MNITPDGSGNITINGASTTGGDVVLDGSLYSFKHTSGFLGWVLNPTALGTTAVTVDGNVLIVAKKSSAGTNTGNEGGHVSATSSALNTSGASGTPMVQIFAEAARGYYDPTLNSFPVFEPIDVSEINNPNGTVDVMQGPISQSGPIYITSDGIVRSGSFISNAQTGVGVVQGFASHYTSVGTVTANKFHVVAKNTFLDVGTVNMGGGIGGANGYSEFMMQGPIASGGTLNVSSNQTKINMNSNLSGGFRNVNVPLLVSPGGYYSGNSILFGVDCLTGHGTVELGPNVRILAGPPPTVPQSTPNPGGGPTPPTPPPPGPKPPAPTRPPGLPNSDSLIPPIVPRTPIPPSDPSGGSSITSDRGGSGSNPDGPDGPSGRTAQDQTPFGDQADIPPELMDWAKDMVPREPGETYDQWMSRAKAVAQILNDLDNQPAIADMPDDWWDDWKTRVPRKNTETFDQWQSRAQGMAQQYYSGDMKGLMSSMREGEARLGDWNDMGDIVDNLKSAVGKDQWNAMTYQEKNALISGEQGARYSAWQANQPQTQTPVVDRTQLSWRDATTKTYASDAETARANKLWTAKTDAATGAWKDSSSGYGAGDAFEGIDVIQGINSSNTVKEGETLQGRLVSSNNSGAQIPMAPQYDPNGVTPLDLRYNMQMNKSLAAPSNYGTYGPIGANNSGNQLGAAVGNNSSGPTSGNVGAPAAYSGNTNINNYGPSSGYNRYRRWSNIAGRWCTK
ncbi:MAG: hypothetical protein K2X29_12770 [Candidatus Obscuribacterales bacterium]|nr:hypothetical protein [Candidatus Obscuribacterales bacterium]